MRQWMMGTVISVLLLFTACTKTEVIEVPVEKDSSEETADTLNDNTSDEGTSTPISTTPQTISGKVVDGYIRNAFACIDLNNNNECDGEEVYTKTDSTGGYALIVPGSTDLSSARVLVSGGVDNSTGKPFIAIMKAPLPGGAGENIFVTPLTTVVVARVDRNKDKEVQSKSLKALNDESVVNQAIADVASSLGLNSSVITKDPIATGDALLLSVTLQVQKTIEVLAEAEKASGETNRTKATARIALALAEQFDGTIRAFDAIVDDAVKSDALSQKTALENTKLLAQTMAKKVALVIESNHAQTLTESVMNDIGGITALIQDEAESLIDNNRANLAVANNVISAATMDSKFDITSLLISSDGTGNVSILEAARVGRIFSLIGYEPTKNDPVFRVFRDISADMTVESFKVVLKLRKVSIDSTTYTKILALVDSKLIGDTTPPPESNTNPSFSTFTSANIAGRVFYSVPAATVMQIIKVDGVGSQISIGNTLFPANISDINNVLFSEKASSDKSYYRAEFVENEDRFFRVYYGTETSVNLWFYNFETAKAYAATVVDETDNVVNIDINDTLVSGKAFTTEYVGDATLIKETINFYDTKAFYSTFLIDSSLECSMVDGTWSIGALNTLVLSGNRVCPSNTTFNKKIDRSYVVHTLEGSDFKSKTLDTETAVDFVLKGAAQAIPKTGYERDNVTEILTDHDKKIMWQDDASMTSQGSIYYWTKNSSDYSDQSHEDTAYTYCNNLALGVFSDWRMPTRDELLSIAKNNSNIKNSPQYGVLYFTSESVDNDTSNSKAYGMNIGTGGILELSKTFGYHIRCVRSF
jgi:hypothetical protein